MNPANNDLIDDIVRRIVETAQPEKIILFGSRARGDARSNSDFDILVIKESSEPRYRRSVPLYVALADVPAEVEVMVYTPEEIDEWRQVSQAFVTTAVREGTTIYERPSRILPRVVAQSEAGPSCNGCRPWDPGVGRSVLSCPASG